PSTPPRFPAIPRSTSCRSRRRRSPPRCAWAGCTSIACAPCRRCRAATRTSAACAPWPAPRGRRPWTAVPSARRRAGGRACRRASVTVALTVHRRERTVAADETYLARLGLALVSDANVFDQYNRLFPRTRDPLQGAPVRDYFVVFPHLTPFADPAKLDATERNDSLYRTPRALLATQGPPSVFALRMHASVSASADRGLLSLNSFQIRAG